MHGTSFAHGTSFISVHERSTDYKEKTTTTLGILPDVSDRWPIQTKVGPSHSTDPHASAMSLTDIAPDWLRLRPDIAAATNNREPPQFNCHCASAAGSVHLSTVNPSAPRPGRTDGLPMQTCANR